MKSERKRQGTCPKQHLEETAYVGSRKASIHMETGAHASMNHTRRAKERNDLVSPFPTSFPHRISQGDGKGTDDGGANGAPKLGGESPSGTANRPPCRNFKRGSCQKGNSCNFSHVPACAKFKTPACCKFGNNVFNPVPVGLADSCVFKMETWDQHVESSRQDPKISEIQTVRDQVFYASVRDILVRSGCCHLVRRLYRVVAYRHARTSGHSAERPILCLSGRELFHMSMLPITCEAIEKRKLDKQLEEATRNAEPPPVIAVQMEVERPHEQPSTGGASSSSPPVPSGQEAVPLHQFS